MVDLEELKKNLDKDFCRIYDFNGYVTKDYMTTEQAQEYADKGYHVYNERMGSYMQPTDKVAAEAALQSRKDAAHRKMLDSLYIRIYDNGQLVKKGYMSIERAQEYADKGYSVKDETRDIVIEPQNPELAKQAEQSRRDAEMRRVLDNLYVRIYNEGKLITKGYMSIEQAQVAANKGYTVECETVNYTPPKNLWIF